MHVRQQIFHSRETSAQGKGVAVATHHKVKPLVMIATPIFAAMEREAYPSHQALTYYCGRNMPDYDFCAATPQRTGFVRARNRVVDSALALDVDWILWLDDDQIVPRDACERLLAHGKDIVSALSFMRGEPYHSMIVKADNSTAEGHRWIHDYPEGLIECDGIPFGCVLTSIKVFKRVVAPWFWDTYGGYGEDIYFAQKAQHAGFKVYADTTVKTVHLGERTRIDEQFAKNYWASCGEKEVVADGGCPIPRELKGEFASKPAPLPTPPTQPYDFWSSHSSLLAACVAHTTGDVLELGMGWYSTPMLHFMCNGNGRKVVSVEHDKAWFDKFAYMESRDHQMIRVDDWDTCPVFDCDWDVVLVDRRPDEGRADDVKKLADRARLIVCHDTGIDQYYDMGRAFEGFKYRYDHTLPGVHPWFKTSVFSNTDDLSWLPRNDEHS